MKKIAFIFSILLITSAIPAGAYIDSQYTTTTQFLTNTGFSAETAKVHSIVTQDPYRESVVEKKDGSSIMRRIYHYIVPGQNDDLDFYNHNGNFDGWGWKDY